MELIMETGAKQMGISNLKSPVGDLVWRTDIYQPDILFLKWNQKYIRHAVNVILTRKKCAMEKNRILLITLITS